MAEIIYSEKRACPFCNYLYKRKVYRKNSNISICPNCKKRSDTYGIRHPKSVSKMKSSIEKRCPICGKNFFTIQHSDVYCSEKCCIKNSNIKISSKKRKMFGVLFLPNIFHGILVDYHHINNACVVPLPTSIHRYEQHPKRNIHRKKCNSWVDYFFGFNIDTFFDRCLHG